MYDSVGKASTDISVSLTATAKTVEVIYTPNAEWLADDERVYPVTIDPSVQTSQYDGNIMDVSVYYAGYIDAQAGNADYLYMGMDYHSYIKFLNVPTIPDSLSVLGAELVMYADTLSVLDENYSGAQEFRLGKMSEAWSDQTSYWQSRSSLPASANEVTYTVSSEITSNDILPKQISLEIPNTYWGNNFNSYFTAYNGFYVSIDYCYLQLNVFSGNYASDATKRPCLIFRYSHIYNYTNINANKIYYLKNRYSGNYITLNNYSQAVTTAPYNDMYNQAVSFYYNTSGGYYWINPYNSDYHYGYNATATNSSDYPLTVTQNTPSTTQWKMVKVSNQTYTIVSNSDPDYVISELNNQAIVRTIPYNDQNNPRDEWILWCNDNSKLLAINDVDNADRSAYFIQTKAYLESIVEGITSIVNCETFYGLNDSEMINYMQNNDIFIIHTHGMQTGFKTSQYNYLEIDDLNNIDLSNLKFALLLTCETGMGYDLSHIINNTPVNIVEKMVICGAETVIGFSEEVYVNDSNLFAKEIAYNLINERMSVSEAVRNISHNYYQKDMSLVAVVAGNGNNKLR